MSIFGNNKPDAQVREKIKLPEDDTLHGFEAMGHTVPVRRLTNALRHMREMNLEVSTEDAFTVIGKAAKFIELDQPYEAINALWDSNILDLCGCYRVLSVLLSKGD